MPRRSRACEELPGRGNHPGDEDKQVDGDATADERRREAPERVAYDHDLVTAADCLHHGAGVRLPAGRLVLDREIDGDSVVPALRATRARPGANPMRSRHLRE